MAHKKLIVMKYNTHGGCVPTDDLPPIENYL